MQLVILAGGMGTRISEESQLRPKPMIEIGGRPIIWHIMKIYAHYGITEFIVCLGYRGYMIKEYFANYFLHQSDVTVDAVRNEVLFHQTSAEPWKVTLIDTGEKTQTGGRLRRVASYLHPDEPFCFTYGDGVADVDIAELIRFHKAKGKLATLTAVAPPARYGALALSGDRVEQFIEKSPSAESLINGGFFVLEPRVLDRIGGDETIWEKGPLEGLARDGELNAFRHLGFWQSMDTMRDKALLEALWEGGQAPWKVWA